MKRCLDMILKKILSVLSISVIFCFVTGCTPESHTLKSIESSVLISNNINEVQADDELMKSVKKIIKVDTVDEKTRNFANLLFSKQVSIEASTSIMQSDFVDESSFDIDAPVGGEKKLEEDNTDNECKVNISYNRLDDKYKIGVLTEVNGKITYDIDLIRIDSIMSIVDNRNKTIRKVSNSSNTDVDIVPEIIDRSVSCKYIGSKDVNIESSEVSKLYTAEEYEVMLYEELSNMLGSDKVNIKICYNDDMPELIIIAYRGKDIKMYINKIGTEVNADTFNIPDYQVVDSGFINSSGLVKIK